ncbi:MAG TPA: Gfo/Idh/MocA family oxidoreductase [Gemmataceae bacterium]|nr:Gfo/Idh/MocA family oxidoreductase [Gemmataceae bacterium]
MPSLDRRRFLQRSAATLGTLTALTAAGAADRPNEKVLLAFMGVRGRGKELIRGFSAFEDVEIAAICDPDQNVIAPAIKEAEKKQKKTPRVEKDVRRVLEDKDIMALVIAAPDHWHALGTIWACQAGKHVYVEKPASHNLIEGRRMVEAARRHDRVVQLGTQRRSAAHFASAAELIRSGKLGKVPFVRTWIAGNRKPIGHKPDGPVPTGVDYDLWLGPAPKRPFNPNRFHYNWHWNWDYGTGEIGNNGIHALDMARFLVGLDAPVRITAGGGKLFYEDDQQTPDTMVATFDFPHTCVIWEHRIWSKTGVEGEPFGIMVYGEKGTLVFDRSGWKVQDGIDASDRSSGTDRAHFRNFLDCVKEHRRPNGDIEEGHKSTRLCHLGNIAFRTGRSLRFDDRSETIADDPEANRLLGRTYREPFVSTELTTSHPTRGT